MRTAIISDLHSNYEALMRVFDDIDDSTIDNIVCCGDIIGYGPEPEKVINEVRTRDIPSVLGNHDAAVIGHDIIFAFQDQDIKTLYRTKELMSEASIEYLKTLPYTLEAEDCLYIHGVPPDKPMDYINRAGYYEISQQFKKYDNRIAFVGHTHKLECVAYDGNLPKAGIQQEGIKSLEKDNRYIINAGSVGQPRDGNPNAKYLIHDNSAQTIETRFVDYDIDITADLIEKLGLPGVNGARLFLGR